MKKIIEKSKNLECLSNVRNQTFKYNIYSKDKNNKLPTSFENILYGIDINDAEGLYPYGLPQKERSNTEKLASEWICPFKPNERLGITTDSKYLFYNTDNYMLLTNLNNKNSGTYRYGSLRNSPTYIYDDVGPLASDSFINFTMTEYTLPHTDSKKITQTNGVLYNIGYTDCSAKLKFAPKTILPIWGNGIVQYFWDERY